MYFLISLFLSFFSYLEFYLNKKSLFKLSLVAITGIILFILLGFNSYSPDLDNYKLHYEYYDDEIIVLAVEPFILFLMRLCQNWGLTFEGYQLVFSFLTLTLFVYSVYKFSPLPSFVFLNFFFIPFFPDITQLRFFLGFSFFLLSLQFYSKNKYIFYCLLTLSILSHLSLSIMIFFLLVRKLEFFKNQLKSNIVIIFGTCVLLFFPRSLFDTLLAAIDPKLLLYTELENYGTFAGTVILFLPFFILNNVVIYYCDKYYDSLSSNLNEKYIIYLPLFIDIIRFSNFMIFLHYFIRDFLRINFNIQVILIICSSYFIQFLLNQKRIGKAKYLVTLITISNLIVFYVQFLMTNNFEYFEVINKTFTSNYLFDSIYKLSKF